MTNILAIDTSTDACSVALWRDGVVSERYEVVPRRHNQRLFTMLRELCHGDGPALDDIDAVAYSRGPGSFTGLRIAASAAQGIAFARDIPAVGISTLRCQAQTAMRLGLVSPADRVLSLIDARINEIYWSVVAFSDEVAVETDGPGVCAPVDLHLASRSGQLVAVGSGLRHAAELPATLVQRLRASYPDCLPSARDLLPAALAELRSGHTVRAEDIAPDYVRNEVSWKKLAEQGKRH